MTTKTTRIPACLALTVVAALSGAGGAPASAQLGPTGTQFWNQDSPGLPLAMQQDAGFGTAVAAGDFDCDGYEDLATSMPGDDLAGDADVGLVLILRGSPVGLTSNNYQLWTQNDPTVLDQGEAGDRFGLVLATGDFNGDGCADLAVGVPLEDIDFNGTPRVNAGAVNVLYGSFLVGLTGDLDNFIYQGVGGVVPGVPEGGDEFGYSLAAGDFDDDGYDDLAIGSPFEDIESASANDAGAIHVLFGSGIGLTASGVRILYRGSGLVGQPQTGEHLGFSLAAGNFNFLTAGDELAVGCPSRNVGSVTAAGSILLLSNLSSTVLVAEYSQDSAGVPGVAEDSDHFGWELAAGDFDGDGVAELAVGAPYDSVSGIQQAGAVNVIDFDGTGGGSQLWTQDSLPPESAEAQDYFGQTLTVGDFDADGVADLASACPTRTSAAWRAPAWSTFSTASPARA